MKNRLIIILTILISITSYGQKSATNKTTGLIIDPNIKNEVEKNIVDSSKFDAYKSVM